jgi:hypothetical protein
VAGHRPDREKDAVLVESDLNNGLHQIVVSPRGYAWLERTVEIVDHGDVDLGDVVLERGRRVVGRVVDSAGRAVIGAEIGCSESLVPTARTDGTGKFALDRMPNDAFGLWIWHEGFALDWLHLAGSQTEELLLHLTRPAFLRGLLAAPPDAPGAKRWIELRRPGSRPFQDVWWTDGGQHRVPSHGGSHWLAVGADGRFEREIPAGVYTAYLGDVALGELRFAEGERREIELIVPAR